MKTKKCANPICDRPPFECKNPKQKYHDIICKNQAAYYYKHKHYAWEVKMQKARWKNIQILEYLIKQGYFRVLQEQLKIMGFDPTAAHVPQMDDQNLPVLRFGNIGMRILSKTECEIFTI